MSNHGFHRSEGLRRPPRAAIARLRVAATGAWQREPETEAGLRAWIKPPVRYTSRVPPSDLQPDRRPAQQDLREDVSQHEGRRSEEDRHGTLTSRRRSGG